MLLSRIIGILFSVSTPILLLSGIGAYIRVAVMIVV